MKELHKNNIAYEERRFKFHFLSTIPYLWTQSGLFLMIKYVAFDTCRSTRELQTQSIIWYEIWYDMWYDMIYDVIYDMIYDVIYDVIYDMIYDMIRYMIYDVIWYMMWYDIWCDMVCYDMIWYDMIWYDIWYDMIYDMIWYMIWYDMIWYDMIWYDVVTVVDSLIIYVCEVTTFVNLIWKRGVWLPPNRTQIDLLKCVRRFLKVLTLVWGSWHECNKG